jgi:CRISPR/Cas system endoribonuclease Cas6 (RAMP superfamily)
MSKYYKSSEMLQVQNDLYNLTNCKSVKIKSYNDLIMYLANANPNVIDAFIELVDMITEKDKRKTDFIVEYVNTTRN